MGRPSSCLLSSVWHGPPHCDASSPELWGIPEPQLPPISCICSFFCGLWVAPSWLTVLPLQSLAGDPIHTLLQKCHPYCSPVSVSSSDLSFGPHTLTARGLPHADLSRTHHIIPHHFPAWGSQQPPSPTAWPTRAWRKGFPDDAPPSPQPCPQGWILVPKHLLHPPFFPTPVPSPFSLLAQPSLNSPPSPLSPCDHIMFQPDSSPSGKR